MIVTDIGDNRKFGRQYIRCIQPPAKAGLNDGYLDAGSGEIVEPQSGD